MTKPILEASHERYLTALDALQRGEPSEGIPSMSPTELAFAVKVLVERVEGLEREKANLTADQYARLLLLVGPPEQPSDDKAPAVEPVSETYELPECGGAPTPLTEIQRWLDAAGQAELRVSRMAPGRYLIIVEECDGAVDKEWLEGKTLEDAVGKLLALVRKEMSTVHSKPQPERFTAPEALPVGAKVRIVEFAEEASRNDLAIGSVVPYLLTDRGDYLVGGKSAMSRAWVRTVELVEEPDQRRCDYGGCSAPIAKSGQFYCVAHADYEAQAVESEPSGNPQPELRCAGCNMPSRSGALVPEGMTGGGVYRCAHCWRSSALEDRSELTRLTEENARLKESTEHQAREFVGVVAECAGLRRELDVFKGQLAELGGYDLAKFNMEALDDTRDALAPHVPEDERGNIGLRLRTVVGHIVNERDTLSARVRELETQLGSLGGHEFAKREAQTLYEVREALMPLVSADEQGDIGVKLSTIIKQLGNERDAANARAERMAGVVEAARDWSTAQLCNLAKMGSPEWMNAELELSAAQRDLRKVLAALDSLPTASKKDAT